MFSLLILVWHRYGFVYFNEDTNIQPIIEVSECLVHPVGVIMFLHIIII